MRSIISLLFGLIPFLGIAQKNEFDSICNLIKTEKNDTNKVRLLVLLANKVKQNDTTEAWQCEKQIELLAAAKNNEFFLAQSYFISASIQLFTAPFTAASNYEKAINIFLQYPDNSRAKISLGAAYINMGMFHSNNNDYTTAIDYYLKSEAIYLKENPAHSNLAILYSNIALTFGFLNKYDESIGYSRKGLDFARKSKDKQYLLNSLYAYANNLINAKREEAKALLLLDSAQALALELNNKSTYFDCEFNKARCAFNGAAYQKGIELYTHCLALARENNFIGAIGNMFINIAAGELELKRIKQAAAHLDSSAKYIDFATNSNAKQMYFENYAAVFRQLGNTDKAFAYKDSADNIRESLYQADNIRQIEFTQARYNYERKEKEVVQLEAGRKIQALVIHQKNTLNYIAVGFAITLLMLSLLAYRNYRQKQKLQQQRIAELETQQQLTATEAVLKGEEQERTRLAKDLHDGLGGMLSGIKYSFNSMKGNLVMTPETNKAFERSLDMLDSSIQEMRRVAHNMMPETLVKFGLDAALKDFCSDINQSGALQLNYQSIGLNNVPIDQTTAITIYRIVQELVNNTLKHAAASTAIVQVTKSTGELSVTVEDDGKGFDAAILNQAKGIGWSNIQNRVDFLKGKLDIHSQPGRGTSVLIELSV
ncbi:sensor histidine kinase [Ferruginibacter paludis]|uniref:tetratricopeptide repeat-containing sensor histidine kinase n=1 Tax=Ferruginibacter paludis TaxID=1310417 RepID=UPI0025B2F4FB|nr:sensor histidine kinase [Ferruginibacter paludis]MDN3655604.1 sensor histidine kinase [Ferruginibacter paludis]